MYTNMGVRSIASHALRQGAGAILPLGQMGFRSEYLSEANCDSSVGAWNKKPASQSQGGTFLP